MVAGHRRAYNLQAHIMLKTRLIAGLSALPVVLYLIYLGDVWFLGGTLVVAWVGAWEFWQITKAKGHHITPVLTVALMTALIVDAYNWPQDYLQLIVSLAVVIPFIWQLFPKQSQTPTTDWALTVIGGLYIGWGMAHLVALRQLADGMIWVLVMLFTTWGADTCAYLIGKQFGRTKLWPRHSPAKTVEGFFGGMVGSILTALTFGLIFSEVLSLKSMVIVGIIVPIFALLGDLCESMMKRDMGVKDTSSLFPGHGGFLDRMDSVLFVSIVIYYYVLWVG